MPNWGRFRNRRSSEVHEFCYTATMSILTPPRRSWFAVWRWKWWVLAVVVLANVLVCYVAAYGMLVDRVLILRVDPVTQEQTAVLEVYYPKLLTFPPGPHRLMHLLFTPAHVVDRKLRPDVWSARQLPSDQ